MKNTKITAAGIICYFDNREGILQDYDREIIYLCLKTKDGEYDFPKGQMDKKEKIVQCAYRETYEEANIDSFDFESVTSHCIPCGRALCMYVGKLKESVFYDNIIKIKKNPVTKYYEHEGFVFLNKEKALDKLQHFLVEALEIADDIIRQQNT